MFRALSLCLLMLPRLLSATGDFAFDAFVDKDKVELGEAIRLTLRLQIQGNMSFEPQFPQMVFEGFQAQGPIQNPQVVNWSGNGQVSISNSWSWELVPIKAGTHTLGPYTAKAKDANLGEIARSTKPISIQVSRPKKSAFNFPTPEPTGTPDPALDELGNIKPDRSPPWGLWASYAAAGLALLAFALWWAFWRKPPPKAEPKPRDPGKHALLELELALKECGQGQEGAYVRRAAGVLRAFLRYRLDLKQEVTLAEALKLPLRRSDAERRSQVEGLRLRLELLLYGNVAAQPADVQALHPLLRDLIIEIDSKAQRPLGATVNAVPKARTKKRG